MHRDGWVDAVDGARDGAGCPIRRLNLGWIAEPDRLRRSAEAVSVRSHLECFYADLTRMMYPNIESDSVSSKFAPRTFARNRAGDRRGAVIAADVRVTCSRSRPEDPGAR